jgi:hypothetical protein
MKIHGVLHGWFETGSEGTSWAIQDEKFIDDKGMYSYDGLHIIEDGDHLEILSPDKKVSIWEGKVSLLGQWHAEAHPYLKQYIKAAPYNPEYKQLSLAGRWIHRIPANVDLGLWSYVFLFKEDFRGVLTKKKKAKKNGV